AGAAARRAVADARARRHAAVRDLLAAARRERCTGRGPCCAHPRCKAATARRSLRSRYRERLAAVPWRAGHGRLLLRAPRENVGAPLLQVGFADATRPHFPRHLAVLDPGPAGARRGPRPARPVAGRRAALTAGL